VGEPEEPVLSGVPPWEQRGAEAFRERRQSWGPIPAALAASGSSLRCGFECGEQPRKDGSSPSCGAARRPSWALQGDAVPPSVEPRMSCDDIHHEAGLKACDVLNLPVVRGSPHWPVS
jgi:hypothetical protein